MGVHSSGEVAGYVIASCLCVMGAGLMSGLTLGLLSMNEMELEVMARTGTERQKHMALHVAPVRTGLLAPLHLS